MVKHSKSGTILYTASQVLPKKPVQGPDIPWKCAEASALLTGPFPQYLLDLEAATQNADEVLVYGHCWRTHSGPMR